LLTLQEALRAHGKPLDAQVCIPYCFCIWGALLCAT